MDSSLSTHGDVKHIELWRPEFQQLLIYCTLDFWLNLDNPDFLSVAGDSLCFLLDTDRDRNVSIHFIVNGLQKSQQLTFRRSHVAMQICLASPLHSNDIDSFSCFTYVFDTADLVIC